ncbi:MAG: universal stress protein [Gammaproteobacteria bacterium]|nr:universal stress protein [Gammaproteobacteria bacterium]
MAEATLRIKTILCIIDPTTNEQRSLHRAAFLARQNGAKVHALLCFTPPQGVAAEDADSLLAAEQRRHELWLEELVKPLRVTDVDVTTEVRSNSDWRSGLADAVRGAKTDLLIKSASTRSPLRRRLMKTSDWLVLREAQCPVLFAKRSDDAAIDKVLAAVNIAATDAAHAHLTEVVFAAGREVAEQLGAQLNVVNAYTDSKNFIHPPDLAKRAGVDRQQAHVGDADPEDLIASVCQKIGAGLVIIGSVGRKGLAAAVVGNTAERILDTVAADILVIVTPPDA